MSSLTKEGSQITAHKKVQSYLKSLYPNGQLEVAFPIISRRADFYLATHQLIIEVQFSPIPIQEIEARCKDYKRIGLSVIWLLDKRYERKWQHSIFEKSKAHYYFFNSSLHSILIYDRLYSRFFSVLRPKMVNLKNLSLIKTDIIPPLMPFCLQKRTKNLYRIEGDYFSSALTSPALLQFITRKEQSYKDFFKTLRLFYARRFKKLLKRCST